MCTRLINVSLWEWYQNLSFQRCRCFVLGEDFFLWLWSLFFFSPKSWCGLKWFLFFSLFFFNTCSGARWRPVCYNSLCSWSLKPQRLEVLPPALKDGIATKIVPEWAVFPCVPSNMFRLYLRTLRLSYTPYPSRCQYSRLGVHGNDPEYTNEYVLCSGVKKCSASSEKGSSWFKFQKWVDFILRGFSSKLNIPCLVSQYLRDPFCTLWSRHPVAVL